MVSINTILDIAVLSIRAGVEASQKGNGDKLVRGRLVPVLKHAGVALAAGAAQVMVVAELVVVSALLDVVQRGLGDLEGGGRVRGGRGSYVEEVSRGSCACVRALVLTKALALTAEDGLRWPVLAAAGG